MFLLPALGSFAADALVVFVHSKYNDLLEPEGKNMRMPFI
jgi:hypothetical protein